MNAKTKKDWKTTEVGQTRSEVNLNRVTRAVFDHFAQSMGPDIANITPLMNDIRHLLAVESDNDSRTGNLRGKALSFIPNEVGGLLMFPEDY